MYCVLCKIEEEDNLLMIVIYNCTYFLPISYVNNGPVCIPYVIISDLYVSSLNIYFMNQFPKSIVLLTLYG